MIHIDLFSGIGGFSLGLKQSGFPITKTYFSEIDKYAITVYRRNFPDAEYIGSVESVSTSRFKGRKTIVTFGFPCQDLSIAGKRKGFDGSRSSLFFEAMRIIAEIKPSIFIFENVKGFYSSNDGKDFQIALQTIADLGLYECQWQLLNTAWFLPQNRERIYFVGSLRGERRPEVFPIREIYKKNVISKRTKNKQCDKSKTQIARTIKANLYKITSDDNYVVRPVLTPDRPTKRQNGRRFKEDGEPFFTLTGQDQHGVMIAGNLSGETWDKRHESAKRVYNPKGISPTVPTCTGGGICPKIIQPEVGDKHGSIRRLTPTECERLQGFPDGWTKYGHEGQGISDTQRYKMCGNAVSVPIVKAIGERF